MLRAFGRLSIALMAIFITILYVGIREVGYQVKYSTDMIETFGPICAKSAMREFQVEDLKSPNSVYLDGGGISASYYNYLSWLRGNSDLMLPATELQDNIDLGITPTNYSLPYLDRKKLEKITNDLLEEQLLLYNSQDGRSSIIGAKVEIIGFDQEFKKFSNNKKMWGTHSDFYQNRSYQTKIYEYDTYVSYNVRMRVTADIKGRFPWYPDLVMPIAKLPYEFNVPYELVN